MAHVRISIYLVGKPQRLRTALFLLERVIFSPAEEKDQAVDGFPIYMYQQLFYIVTS